MAKLNDYSPKALEQMLEGYISEKLNLDLSMEDFKRQNNIVDEAPSSWGDVQGVVAQGEAQQEVEQQFKDAKDKLLQGKNDIINECLESISKKIDTIVNNLVVDEPNTDEGKIYLNSEVGKSFCADIRDMDMNQTSENKMDKIVSEEMSSALSRITELPNYPKTAQSEDQALFRPRSSAVGSRSRSSAVSNLAELEKVMLKIHEVNIEKSGNKENIQPIVQSNQDAPKGSRLKRILGLQKAPKNKQKIPAYKQDTGIDLDIDKALGNSSKPNISPRP